MKKPVTFLAHTPIRARHTSEDMAILRKLKWGTIELYSRAFAYDYAIMLDYIAFNNPIKEN